MVVYRPNEAVIRCNIRGDVIYYEVATVLMSVLLRMTLTWIHGLLDAHVLRINVMVETQALFLAFGLRAQCWV